MYYDGQRHSWKTPKHGLLVGLVPSTNEYERVILDDLHRLQVSVPDPVDVVVQNFPDPQNVNISAQDIPVEVTPRPSASSGPSRVSVGDSAAPLLSAGATRRSLVLYNDGPDTVWIGNTDTVDETNGWPLLLGSSFNFGMNDNNEDMYGRCATGETALVHVWEVSY